MAIIKIDHDELSGEALKGMIKDFIFTMTMNMTGDFDMDEEIKKVIKLLDKGKAEIYFDEETENFNIEILKP